MTSETHGTNTLEIDVLDISSDGIEVSIDGEVFHLDYARFPWFKSAQESKIKNVKRLTPEHLYWEDLDVDLELDCIKHPERYPLIYQP